MGASVDSEVVLEWRSAYEVSAMRLLAHTNSKIALLLPFLCQSEAVGISVCWSVGAWARPEPFALSPGWLFCRGRLDHAEMDFLSKLFKTPNKVFTLLLLSGIKEDFKFVSQKYSEFQLVSFSPGGKKNNCFSTDPGRKFEEHSKHATNHCHGFQWARVTFTRMQTVQALFLTSRLFLILVFIISFSRRRITTALRERWVM